MTWLRLLWELLRKDLRLFLADRPSAVLCFAVPIVLASAFGAVFQRPARSYQLPRLPLRIVCEDDAPLSRRVTASLCDNPQVDARECSRDEAWHFLEKESAGAVLILPRGFAAGACWTGRQAQPVVETYSSPQAPYAGKWAEGVLTEAFVRESAAVWLGGKQTAYQRPFAVRHDTAAGQQLAFNSYNHAFCGMTLQYLLFWGMDSGLLLLRERRRGIWRRLRTTPAPGSILILSKVLFTALVALAQIAVTFAFGALAFGVRIGSPAGLGLLAVAAAVLAACTGLLVAALGGSEGRARSLAIVAILTLSLLGGLWLPAFLLPEWVQQMSVVLPTAWAAKGFASVTGGNAGLAGALPCAAALAGFSTLFLLLALWGLRRTELQALCKGET